MAVEKEHKEFFRLNFSEGWEPIPGYPSGMEHRILAGYLDEANKRGARTRLMRIPAGTFTTKPFIHEYWEEVYVLSGDTTVLALNPQTAEAKPIVTGLQNAVSLALDADGRDRIDGAGHAEFRRESHRNQ